LKLFNAPNLSVEVCEADVDGGEDVVELTLQAGGVDLDGGEADVHRVQGRVDVHRLEISNTQQFYRMWMRRLSDCM